MESLRVYHLQLNKVASLDKISRMPVIESILVKLTGILELKKYCLYLKQESTIPENPPYIKKVLIDEKDAGEDEKQKAQAILAEILKPAEKKLSYKEAFEEQEKRNIELGKRLAALETHKQDGVESPEIDNIREQLKAKATSLNITFRSNLGNEKLLLKIQDIEPEFQL